MRAGGLVDYVQEGVLFGPGLAGDCLKKERTRTRTRSVSLLSSIVGFDFRLLAKVLRQFDWCCRPSLATYTLPRAPWRLALKSRLSIKKWLVLLVLPSLRLASLHYYGNQWTPRSSPCSQHTLRQQQHEAARCDRITHHRDGRRSWLPLRPPPTTSQPSGSPPPAAPLLSPAALLLLPVVGRFGR